MKKQFTKYFSIIALAVYAAAVFMIADGCYWIGIVFICAGTSLMAAGADKMKRKL